jgi:hypothetical protein
MRLALQTDTFRLQVQGWAVGQDAFKLIMNRFFFIPANFLSPLFGVRYLRIGWN